MFIRRSIMARMALMVLLGAGCILGVIIGYTYVAVRGMLMAELETKARYMALATVNHIETVERSVAKVVQGMAVDLETGTPSTNGMYRLLRRTLENNPDIYGAAIALKPSVNVDGNSFCAPYVFREKGRLVEKNLGAGNYRYDIWDWFLLPQKMKEKFWCEPYFDEGGGNILMVTYSVPIFRSNEFWGVVTSDVSLEWLNDLLASLSADKGGYAWLVSANGTFITHPVRELIMNDTVFSTSEIHPDPVIRAAGRKIGRRMIRGESDFVPFTSVVSGKKGWLFFAPIRATGWSLAIMFSRDELMRQIFSLNRVIIGLGLAGIALLLAMAVGIARSITNPLRRLALATQTLAQGNLNAPLPEVKGEDEVARLAFAFERMRADLQKYIAKLQETTAVKERIESEMRIARAIQMDLVPKTFPPFPNRNDMDIFGILDPAREVGGDFYDFFMPDEKHIFLFIGDVSGKGMPAALFMAVTRTLLKAISREERSPSVILRRLNSELAEGNDANMFVTLFCVLIDLADGSCRFSNGGHNPPFVLRESGAITPLPTTGGCVVGVMPGVEFGEDTFTLRPGETLFIYTDGVTEAMNSAGDMFGENQVIAELRQMQHLPGAEIVRSMRETLRRYTAGAEQSDDVTMLVFRLLSGN